MKRMIVWSDGSWWRVTMPDSPDVKELFGTDTLPTAFRATMPVAQVLAQLKAIPENATFDIQLAGR